MENTLLTGVVQSGGPANPQAIFGATVIVFEARNGFSPGKSIISRIADSFF
jgi:hypothetical protein